jgi:hypothetical protein
MKFTVVWRKRAEADLADIWMNATNRGEVTRAANEIDRRLAINPQNQGESRELGVRILAELPLMVHFFVVPKDCKVHVLQVWKPRKKAN